MRAGGRTNRRIGTGPLAAFLTFERPLTGRLIHLVYWAGLGVIALIAFAVIGTAVGLAFDEGWQGVLLALPVLVGGLLVAAALVLLWRSFCEFYLAVFRISEDLRALRAASDGRLASALAVELETGSARPLRPAPSAPVSSAPVPSEVEPLAAAQQRRFF